jgi:hypothetical protein
MQLFTVKMIAKRFISLFDFNGDKTGERVEEIPQVYRDLPMQTAQTYKRQFPDNKVEIEAQHGEYAGEGRIGARPVKNPDYDGIRKKVTKRFEKTLNHLAKTEREANTLTAAQTGDMAAAINAEMKS